MGNTIDITNKIVTIPGDSAQTIYDENNLVIAHLENGGSQAIDVDGSTTPVTFSYTPTVGKDFDVKRIMVYMEGTTAFSSEKFGNLTALTNGIELLINGTVVWTVKDNVELAITMYDLTGVALMGKETQTMLGRFTLANLTEGGAGVTITDGSSIAVTVNDDLSALVRFEVVVEGHEIVR